MEHTTKREFTVAELPYNRVTKEEAEAAIRAMLGQAKEDGYEDSIGNYVIVEMDGGENFTPPFANINK